MPEPVAVPENELAVLRQTNAELTAKGVKRSKRIAELVASTTALQAENATLKASIQEMTITQPLKRMAEAVSSVPDLWMMMFEKHFKLESKDGTLSVLTLDGAPALDTAGKPLEFTQKALLAHLTKSKLPEFKDFNHVMIQTRASGSGAASAQGGRNVTGADNQPAAKPPTAFVGFR